MSTTTIQQAPVTTAQLVSAPVQMTEIKLAQEGHAARPTQRPGLISKWSWVDGKPVCKWLLVED